MLTKLISRVNELGINSKNGNTDIKSIGKSIRVKNSVLKIVKKLGLFLSIIKLNNSKHIKSKDALVESETRYRRLFESAKDGILILDAESGMIDDVNPYLIDLLGYSKEKLIQKRIWELGLFKDILENQEKFLELQQQEYVRYDDLPLKTSDGRKFHVEFVSNVYLVNGKKVIQCNIRNITERKNSEKEKRADELLIANEELLYQNAEKEKRANELLIANEELAYQNTEKKNAEEKIRQLSTVVDQSPNAVVIADLEGNIEYINQKFSDNSGYPAERIIGKKVLILRDDATTEEMKADIWETISDGKIWVGEYLSKKINGERYWESVKIAPIFDLNGIMSKYLVLAEDITERIQTEKDLIMSENELKKAQQITHIGSWYLDLETNNVVWTEELYRMYGFDSSLPPPPYTEHMKLFTPESWEMLSSSLAKTSETGIPYELELKTVRKDGTSGWMWVRGETDLDKDGKTVGLWGAAQDITERKRAEEKLQESEEKYRNIFDNAQEGIFQTNINGTYISANPALAKMYGFDSPEELINTRLDISKDSYYDAKERDKFLRIIKKQGFIKGYEYEVKKNDGTKIWFYEDALAIKDESGQIQYFEGFVIDITERKVAEEKQQLQITALNAAANAIVITNNKGAIEWVNSAFTTLTGYDFADSIGKNPSELVKSGMHDNPFYQDLLDTILAGEIWRGETTNRRKNGTLYNEMQTITPLKETDGKINHFIIIKEDITERKQAEQELIIANKELAYQNKEKEKRASELIVANKELLYQNAEKEKRATELIIAKEKAEESDNLKTAFLQNMSHEIRTPLIGIIGFSNLLSSPDLSPDDIKEFTDMIKISGNRLIEIVNNILDISIIQTGQVRIEKNEIDINSLFSELLAFFSNLVNEKNLILNYANQNDTDITLFTDETKLNQILTNLINNAIKFTKSGCVDFGYEIKGNVIEIFVRDTGIGILPEMQNKIFERFIQADITISRGYEGAGIGLAICKGLVELLGGKIWVESELGKGTTFYFTLPYNYLASNYIEGINEHRY